MFSDKLKASFLHFSISLFLVILVIGSMLLLFFPRLYLGVTDFKDLSYIILSVDLILGPLLTFVIFNPQKSKSALFIDFTVVGAIQLSALIYGAYTLYQVHPVYITFNIDRFTIIPAKDAEPEKAKFAEYIIPKYSSGVLAFAKLPTTKSQQDDLLLETISGGEDLDRREEYYQPYSNNISQIIEKSIDPDLIFTGSNLKLENVELLKGKNDDLSSYAFLPLNSANKDAIIVLKKKTGLPITTLNIDPWKLTKK